MHEMDQWSGSDRDGSVGQTTMTLPQGREIRHEGLAGRVGSVSIALDMMIDNAGVDEVEEEMQL